MFLLHQVICASIFVVVYSRIDQIYVQNLDERCLRCLCYAATNCDTTLGCNNEYCGPYKISRAYWIDAGRVVLSEDDPHRSGAFEDCAANYRCAQKMVRHYMAKFGQDCNANGVTDCHDYSMINFNGGHQCESDLTTTEAGRNWTRRFSYCAPSL